MQSTLEKKETSAKEATLIDLPEYYRQHGKSALKNLPKLRDLNGLTLLQMIRIQTATYLEAHDALSYPGCKAADDMIQKTILSSTPEKPISTIDAVAIALEASNQAHADSNKWFGKSSLSIGLNKLVQHWYTDSALVTSFGGDKAELARLKEELQRHKENYANQSVGSVISTTINRTINPTPSEPDSLEKDAKGLDTIKNKPAYYLHKIVKKLETKTDKRATDKTRADTPSIRATYAQNIRTAYLHLKDHINSKTGKVTIPRSHPEYLFLVGELELLKERLDWVVKIEATEFHDSNPQPAALDLHSKVYKDSLNNLLCNLHKKGGYLFADNPSKVVEYHALWTKPPAKESELEAVAPPASAPSKMTRSASKRASALEGTQSSSPNKRTRVDLTPAAVLAASMGSAFLPPINGDQASAEVVAERAL